MSAPVYTLANLLTAQNLDLIRTRLLATIQGAGFPAITEWQPKQGVEMGWVNMVGGSLADLIAADLPAIVAGGFLGEATGLWMDLLAETVYLLKRVGATKTTFNMDLVVAATAGPYTWAVGDVEVVGPTGNRYRNTTGGTAAGGQFATLAFEAEATGSAYADNPTNGALGLVTTFAGVTARSSAPPFSSIVQSGSSTGRIVPQTPTIFLPPASFEIRIDVTGDPGTARASIQVNGGAWFTLGILKRTQEIAPGGVDAGFAVVALAGSGTPSSFQAGDTFVFSAPGGPSFVHGRDAESDAQLAARCRSRWPSLSLNPTEGLFRLWALLAFPGASRIQVSPDLASDPTAIAGRVSMWLADSSGPLDADGLALITSYVVPKLSVLDGFVARAAPRAAILASGSVLVTPATLVAVQQAAEEAWLIYLGTVPLGGTVEIAKLSEVLMDAGAVDAGYSDPLLLNGTTFDTVLATGQVAVEADTLINSLEWTF